MNKLNINQSVSHRSNTIRTKVKAALIISAVSILSLSSLSAYTADYSRAEKELRIMNKIFETSISDAKVGRSHFGRFGSETKAIYLAKQGMVFTFNFGQSSVISNDDWRAFGEGVGQLVGSISAEIVQSLGDIDVPAPVAPVPPVPGGDWEDNIEAYEAYQEAMEDLRDEQRDKRQEVRELQRSIREIERQARKEEVDTKKLEITKKKLEEKMAILEKKMKQYEVSRKEYQEKKRAKYKLNSQKKSDLIITTLCDYGTTLRSLESREHVTLIFSGYDEGKDQIHVFNYNDVKNCKNKDALLKKAVSYQL